MVSVKKLASLGNLSELVQSLQLKPDRIAVELNREIVASCQLGDHGSAAMETVLEVVPLRGRGIAIAN